MSELNTAPIDGVPGGSPDDNQSKLQADETALKNRELEDKLRKAEEEKENYKRAFLNKKEELETIKFSQPNPIYQPLTTNQNPSSEDIQELVQAEVQKKLGEQAEVDRQTNVQRALSRFFEKYPQYKPENDLNDENYSHLKEKADGMVLGKTENEVLNSLEFIHRGLSVQNPINDSVVVDSGIGETSKITKGKTNLPSALTRSLNEHEKKASEWFPGGESAYRKALAEREAK